MLSYNVLAVTDNQVFNWAFTLVIVWFPALFGIKAIIRTISRS